MNLTRCSMVLIDTQWNVNSVVTDLQDRREAVLIDTQWNVNIFSSKSTKKDESVLIDTQWNVNQIINQAKAMMNKF